MASDHLGSFLLQSLIGVWKIHNNQHPFIFAAHIYQAATCRYLGESEEMSVYYLLDDDDVTDSGSVNMVQEARE